MAEVIAWASALSPGDVGFILACLGLGGRYTVFALGIAIWWNLG